MLLYVQLQGSVWYNNFRFPFAICLPPPLCWLHLVSIKVMWELLTCQHLLLSMSSFLKNPVLFSLLLSFLFLQNTDLNKRKHHMLCSFLSCSISSGKCFFFHLKSQTCQGQFKTEYFFSYFLSTPFYWEVEGQRAAVFQVSL